jgi:hypothetical protein
MATGSRVTGGGAEHWEAEHREAEHRGSGPAGAAVGQPEREVGGASAEEAARRERLRELAERVRKEASRAFNRDG